MNKFKIKSIIKEYTLLLLGAFFVSSSIIQLSLIPTGSMETTIRVGDFLAVNRLAYDFYTPRYITHTSVRLPFFEIALNDGPEKGDIVVFEFPGYRDEMEFAELQSWVKRCVGTPGDTIMIRDRILFVNGKEFPIPNRINYEFLTSRSQQDADPGIFPKYSGWNEDNYGPIAVPKKGEVIKLDKNNFYTYEMLINRELGKLTAQLRDDKVFIDGKQVDSYTIKQNYYFMMGDNRNNSADSRYWGFVGRDKILGTPFLVFWSWDSNIPFSEFFKLLGSVRFDRIGRFL